MGTNRGQAFLLKVTDDGTNYATVAGLKADKIDINGEALTVKPIPKGAWRELVSSGARSVDVEATGIFTGSSAEAQIRRHALSGSIDGYELSFESGERLRGRFMVMSLWFVGDFNGERTYRIELASSGEVVAL